MKHDINIGFNYKELGNIKQPITLNMIKQLSKEELITIMLLRQSQYHEIMKYFRVECGKLVYYD